MTAIPADMETDRTLVAAFLAAADEAAFRRLYAAHTPRLFLWLVRLCGGRTAEAEELLQETWIRAVGRLRSFRWESRLGTWLSGIAWNAWRESVRARGRRETPFDADSGEVPAPDAPAAERLDLERALERLPEGYREVLLLHDVEGYTHEEISSLLGISPGTSKSQLFRARRWLRRRLEGSAAEPEREARR